MKIVALINSNREYTYTLKEYLEFLGYRAIGNFSSKESLQKCQKIQQSSIAIIDHTVQIHGDGVEFANFIKKINHQITIIYTIQNMEQAEEPLLKLKPYRILLKPIDRNELKIALRMLESA